MTMFIHDTNAVLDYRIDWSAWLAAGDTISGHQLTIDPDAAVTIDSSTADDTSVTAWISGGTADQTVRITCHITTIQGREDDRTIVLGIRDR